MNQEIKMFQFFESFKQKINNYILKFGFQLPKNNSFRVGYIFFPIALMAAYFLERSIFAGIPEYFATLTNYSIPTNLAVRIYPLILMSIDLIMAYFFFQNDFDSYEDYLLSIRNPKKFFLFLAAMALPLASVIYILKAIEYNKLFAIFFLSSLALTVHGILFFIYPLLPSFINYIKSKSQANLYNSILLMYNRVVEIQRNSKDIPLSLTDDEVKLLNTFGLMRNSGQNTNNSATCPLQNEGPENTPTTPNDERVNEDSTVQNIEQGISDNPFNITI